MKIVQTKIEGVYILTPEPKIDSRGYFERVFAKEELKKVGIDFSIAHINRSRSYDKGVIRGMHYQIKPMEEDKIVQCLSGKIFDVAIDLRKNSKTFGQWVGQILDSEDKNMMLTPKGCAHGFQTLEENSLVEYFSTQIFSPENERGVRFNDPQFSIDWPIEDFIISEKDRNWPDFKI